MKKDITLMKLVVACLAVSSFSLILVKFGDYNGTAANVAAAVIAGLLFWLFLIFGYIIFAQISKHRKQHEKSVGSSGGVRTEKVENKKKPGIICFFSDRYAAIADIVMILSIILTVVVIVFIPTAPQLIQLILISILVFSIHMHCILNGVNFRYIRKLSNKA